MLPPELALKVQPVLKGFPRPSDNDWPSKRVYIVVSQDCDVVNGDFAKEPTVEVVLAKKVKRFTDSLRSLRNPRILHVALKKLADGSPQPVAVTSSYRGHIDHELLLAQGPDQSLAAEGAAVQEIAALIGRRYVRGGRPDAFDARIKPVLNEITDFLDRSVGAGMLLDVLLRIEPMDELEPGVPYDVKVYGVLTDTFDDLPKSETRERIDALQRELWMILSNCDDIIIDQVEIVGRAQLSIRHAELLRSLEIVWPRFVAAEQSTATTDDDSDE